MRDQTRQERQSWSEIEGERSAGLALVFKNPDVTKDRLTAVIAVASY